MFFSLTIYAILSFINPGGGKTYIFKVSQNIQPLQGLKQIVRLLSICYPVSLRGRQLTRYNNEKHVVQQNSTIKNINDPHKANQNELV